MSRAAGTLQTTYNASMFLIIIKKERDEMIFLFIN